MPVTEKGLAALNESKDSLNGNLRFGIYLPFIPLEGGQGRVIRKS